MPQRTAGPLQNGKHTQLELELVRRKITNKTLAARLGVSGTTMTRMLHGRSAVSPSQRQRIANLLGVSRQQVSLWLAQNYEEEEWLCARRAVAVELAQTPNAKTQAALRWTPGSREKWLEVSAKRNRRLRAKRKEATP